MRATSSRQPRPEELGMDSVTSGLSKGSKKGSVAPFQKDGPRTLMYYRGEDGCVMSLVWEERELVKEDKKFLPRVKVYHLLHRGRAGEVVHETLDREAAHHPAILVPTASRTTPEGFEDYLRGCLRTSGGASAVWRLLGLDPPAHEVVSLPGSQPAHDEMYQRAAKLLGVPEAELRAKYGHLNPGLQQMNLRNRLRGKGFNV